MAAKDSQIFENAIQALEATIANIGAHITLDSSVRMAYAQQIQIMANDLREQVSLGKITWSQAASEAQVARNAIMDIFRGRSTPVGQAIAEFIKRQGKTLNELVANKAGSLYGPNINFGGLSPVQKNTVYAEIVKSAGKSHPSVTAIMSKLRYAGRGLIVISIALSVYEVIVAEDKAMAAGRELTITGAGIGGGIAGGALAGLACGPGAPVCVGVGAFVGGVFGAFGVSLFW